MKADLGPRPSPGDLQDDMLAAGDFLVWLQQFRHALIHECGVAVDCSGCDACCSSSSFIHIRPEETRTLAKIPKKLLFPVPGMPKGHVLLGYDENGCCPMLKDGQCSIYAHRPFTCRHYDCRVFTAAGIAPGGADKVRVTNRIRRWQFSFPTAHDRAAHAAIQAAARFIPDHASHFPGGAIPNNPSQLAIVAIKAYQVFLSHDRYNLSNHEIAAALVAECRQFDMKGE